MKKHFRCLNVLIIAAVMLTADGHTDAAAPQKPSITVWFNAGLGNALQAMELNIEDFHKVQDSYEVEMTLIPEGMYTDRILVAGQTGDLPDLLFFDGPMVSYLAWLGYLQPIDRFVSTEMKADLLSFSRMGRSDMIMRPVELAGLVHEVIGELQPEIEGRKIHGRSPPCPSSPEIAPCAQCAGQPDRQCLEIHTRMYTDEHRNWLSSG